MSPTIPLDYRRRDVLSRLQNLFPQQNNNNLTHDNDEENDSPLNESHTSEPKFLKIRIVTWNMHDSVPKGDLEDLLGKVPYYDTASAKSGNFPHLPEDTSNHPFHLVVISGQECPTPSGIPMGLGAGFKLVDKDREKLKEGDKEDKPNSEVKDKERAEDVANAHEKLSAGWTQMLEDWLCNGVGSPKTGSPCSVEIGAPRPLVRQKSAREPRKGPYQLLTKERLMGIYLAIYIHRDLKPLVQGISKSSVTTGLIGGRIGNKGGVGISLNIDGTTFLFLNAHLAAHEGKVHHRLANLSKIKTELEVDTFLPNDDPRAVAEDLTDKFDFTFLFGDLNFRLDISRLHADWLISRQEYRQAFEFDQLHTIMKKGGAFDGFQEAMINFPPTFKYDVSRPHKRRRRSRSGDLEPLSQAEERQNEMVDEDEGTDVVSLSSSVTSFVSRDQGLLDEDFEASPLVSTTAFNSNIQLSSKNEKKSKPKWLSVLSPSFTTSPKFPRFQNVGSVASPLTPTTPNTAFSTSLPSATTPKTATIKKRFLRPPPMMLANPSVSQSSMLDETVEEEKGVYDSSSKKRVPSWCDRILWKTTIIREIIEDDFSPHIHTRLTTRRVSHFFSSFRSPLSRSPPESNRHPISGGVLSDGQARHRSPAVSPTLQTNQRTLSALQSSLKSLDSPNSRRSNTTFTTSPPSTAPLPVHMSPRRSTTGSPNRPRSSSGSIWRFLPAFLSPNNTGTFEPPQTPKPLTHVKGDVVCLSYGTLDDRKMKKLEGRSDHRPVIGAYAIYL